jgi:hypothetical protein
MGHLLPKGLMLAYLWCVAGCNGYDYNAWPIILGSTNHYTEFTTVTSDASSTVSLKYAFVGGVTDDPTLLGTTGAKKHLFVARADLQYAD